MSDRIVITGRGAVTAAGIGCGPLHDCLASGQHAFRLLSEVLAENPSELEQGGLFHRGPQEQEDLDEGVGFEDLDDLMIGADFGLDLSGALEGRNLRPLDRTSSLLICAVKEALEDGGWSPEARAALEVGLVLGTTFCSAHTIAAFDRRALVAGPRYASPLDFANTVINAATGLSLIHI